MKKKIKQELSDYLAILYVHGIITEKEHLKFKRRLDNSNEPDESTKLSIPNIGISLSPDIAENILKVRDAIIEKDYDEAWHWLYTIASPNYDKTADEVWTDLERIAGRL